MRNPLRLLLHVPVPWVFVLVYLFGAVLERAAPTGFDLTGLRGVGLAGEVVFGAGVVIAGCGWLMFRRARTTTVPGQASSKLVTGGLYRFTRNPMYVGLHLAYVGEALLLRQVWPLLLLPLVFGYINWIVVPVEEARLREVFGDEYDKYRATVRRWI